MTKESISGKIKTILSPEKEVEELNEKRKEALGYYISQEELASPTGETIQKLEGILNEMKKRYKPVEKVDPSANDRRFGPK